MKETYELIIMYLERDKAKFTKEIYQYIDDAEYNDASLIKYERAKSKIDYISELIEFFTEVKDHIC